MRCVCVHVISIPWRGFILPNVSSTWSRLREHDGIDTGLPRGAGSVSERSVSNKTLLSCCQRYGHLGSFCSECSSPETPKETLWMTETQTCKGFPTHNVQKKSFYLLKTSDTPEINCAFLPKYIFGWKAPLNVSWQYV